MGQAKSAAGKLIALMGKALEDENSRKDWAALSYSQALLALHRLYKANAIDLVDQAVVEPLLGRLGTNPGDIKRTDADQGWARERLAMP